MVNQNDTRTTSQKTSNDIHRSTSAGFSRSNKTYANDDVIAMLANAPENRRARQVGEWERMRVHVYRTAA